MPIGGLQKFTLIDYPGKIACTVFLIGCNFRCPWCYNPELVLPEKIKKNKPVSEKYFFNFLARRKGLLEGVVICGGEPTINENLPDFIKKIKKAGYAVKIDTNGSNPEMLENLIKNKLIDYVAMDIKASLTQFPISPAVRDLAQRDNFSAKGGSAPGGQFSKYDEAAGARVDLEKIKKSVEIIKNSGIGYEFRTTMVPKLHRLKDIAEIAKQLKGAKIYFLQQFQPQKTISRAYEKVKPYSHEQLPSIQKECQKYLPAKLR